MKTIEINLYKFSELSEESKQKAINKWYESEDYPMLSDDLTESCKALLEENKIKYSDIKLYYSLDGSQGDGLCFTGELIKDSVKLKLTHNARYYYASSVNMEFFDTERGCDLEDIDDTGISITELNSLYEISAELKEIYFDICKKLEKEGYAILEYRMTPEEFNDHCEANEYYFLETGIMRNN